MREVVVCAFDDLSDPGCREFRIGEGDWPFNRSVLVRCETEVAAVGWYNSDAYQRVLEHRLAASVGNIVLVRGLGEKGK